MKTKAKLSAKMLTSSEFDFATGTYKQVTVDWSEIQKRMSASGIGQSNQPVPSVNVTPVERMMH